MHTSNPLPAYQCKKSCTWVLAATHAHLYRPSLTCHLVLIFSGKKNAPPHNCSFALPPLPRVLSQRTGYRTAASIKAANDQLQHFCDLLEGEGVVVRRPDEMDFGTSVKTPDWEIPRQNTSACPRDLLLTVGNEVIEATMSWRSRFFEYRPYRSYLNELYRRDPAMLWTCAPKPLMRDNLYRADYPQVEKEED